MTATTLLKSVDPDRAMAMLEAPNDAEAWDLAGQHFIRLKDLPSAIISFKRSEVAGPPFLENHLYRLAQALEINKEFGAAAIRYIRVYEEKTTHSRDALYRAVTCLHRAGSYAAISALLLDLNPSDWRGYREFGLIAALAFSERGNSARAASWLFIDPGISERQGNAWDLLSKIIDNTTINSDQEDAKRFILETAHAVFVSPLTARKVLRWLIRSGHTNMLKALIADPVLIRLSNGQNLSHAAIFKRDTGSSEAGYRAARMALALRPDDPSALSAILPEANGFDQVVSQSTIRWAKATIIQQETEDFAVNEAVIALKTAELEDLTTLYLARAANRFKATPALLYNIASHFNEKALAERAQPLLKRAVLMEPAYAKAWSAYTVAACTLLESDDGVTSSLRALIADPNVQSGYTNLAMAYRGAGKLELAIEAGKEQVQRSPMDAVARMGLAFNQLAIGAIEEGFENYRCRWAQKSFPSAKRPFPQPEWALQRVPEGKKVLIYMEQGMGDELMFSWFLKYADELAPNQIVVECDPRLVSVFRRSFPTIEFWPMTGPAQKRLLAPDISYKLPAGHLPDLFADRLRDLIEDRCGLESATWVGGYSWIVPDPMGLAHWRRRLSDLRSDNRLTIGIAWRSGNLARARRSQYVSPRQIADSLPDNCVAVILQYVYEEGELAEIQSVAAERGIDVVVFDDLDLKDGLSDVVDLCAAVDCILTPLTSTAFMGGVIGTPTWVFRTSSSYNIWQQLGTQHIPWIPSIRLRFRHPLETWDEVVSEMRRELTGVSNKLVERRCGVAPVCSAS